MPNQVFNPIFIPLIFACALGVARLLILAGGFFRKEAAFEPGRNLPLDGFRGYLAMGVVVHHALSNYQMSFDGVWAAPRNYLFFFVGRGSVDFFFMITGYLFWDKVLRSGGHISIKRLLRSRIRRIMPLYSATAVAVVVSALVIVGLRPRVPTAEYVISILRWVVGGGLLGDPKVNGYLTHPINAGVTWTLQYEWYFYLLLPLFAYLARPTFSRPWLLIPLAGVVLAVFHLLDVKVWYSGRFLQGMAAAHLLRLVTKVPKWVHSKKTSVLLLVLLAPCAVRPLPFRLDFWMTYVVFLGVLFGNSLFGTLTNAPARLLGHISYSVYLVHGLVFFGLVQLVGRSWLGTLSPMEFWAVAVPASMLVVLVAAHTYRFIEKPFIRSH